MPADSRSKMALSKLKEDMVNCVATSKAIFKNEQIDEPDLELSEKKNIASKILEASPGQFLHRFGKYMKKEHFEYFDSLETCAGSYELDFYLQEAKKNLSEASELIQKKHVKNRRYAALKKLINEGSPYFSETEMRRRDPLMYEHLVGRHLTEEEKDDINRMDMSSMTLLGLLLDHMDRDAARALKAQQEEYEDAAREESDSDSEENEDKEKPEVPEEERDLLRQEFISHMYRNFIEGKDKDFDYNAVDENTEYDNLEVEQQDAEDKYFDAESPSEEPPSNKECEETSSDKPDAPSPTGRRHYDFESQKHKLDDPFFDSDRPDTPSPTGRRHYDFESQKHKLNDPFFDSDRPDAPSPTGKRHYDFESQKHNLNDPFFDSDKPNAPSPTGKQHYECETEKHELGHPYFDSDNAQKPQGKKHFESQKQEVGSLFDSEKTDSSLPNSSRQSDLKNQEVDSLETKKKPHGKRHYEFESEKHKLEDPFFDADKPTTQPPSGKHHYKCETEKHELNHPYFDSDKTNDKHHGKRHYDIESKKLELGDPFFDAEKSNGKPHGKKHYEFESQKHNLGDPFFDSDNPEKVSEAKVTQQKSSSSEDELDVYMKSLMNQEVKSARRKQFPGKATESSFAFSTPSRSDDVEDKLLTSSMEVECSSISNQSVDDEAFLPHMRRSHPQGSSPSRKESPPVDENDEAYLTNIPRPTSPTKK